MTIKTSNRWNEIWAHNIWTSFWIRPDFGKAHNEWNCTEASRAFIEFIVLSVVLLFVNIKWRHCDWKCTVATQTQHTQTHTLSHRMMIQLWCFSSVCTRWLNGKWMKNHPSTRITMYGAHCTRRSICATTGQLPFGWGYPNVAYITRYESVVLIPPSTAHFWRIRMQGTHNFMDFARNRSGLSLFVHIC